MTLCQPLLLLAALAFADADTVCLFYGSEDGTTENVAEYIGIKTGLQPVPIGLINDHPAGPDLFQSCDHYIIGAPTLESGKAQGMTGTAWDIFLPGKFKEMGSLAGKTVAVFGTGDQNMYPFNFCDAMDELARAFVDQGAKLVGAWTPDTEEAEEEDRYFYEKSKALWPELGGAFVGLPLDEVSQQHLTGERIREWLDKVRYEGMPVGHETCEDDSRRSRSLQAGVSTEMDFYSAWSQKLGCWFRALPLPSQQQFGACMGALGLHVGSRFDAAFGRFGAPLATDRVAQGETNCNWLKEGSPQLQNFPEFPSMGDFKFQLPPIPRLVPRGALHGIFSYYDRPSSLHAAARAYGTQAESSTASTGVSPGLAVAGGLAGGAASALLIFGVFRLVGSGRTAGRPALQRRATELSEPAMSC